jgi:hypothetical protein
VAGWTVIGGPGARGREARPLPGGGVDWSRPRCEPDNRPHVVLGRLLAVAAPLLAALPAMWFGLPLSERLGIRAADWLTGHGLSAWLLLTGPVGLLLTLAATVGLIRSGGPARTRTTTAARVRVHVTSVPPSMSYPAGQLVFRVVGSPALQPTSVEPTQGPTVLEGRWSA